MNKAQKSESTGTKTPVVAKEKAKVLGFVNWALIDENGKIALDANGKPVLKSSRGFSILDNGYCSKQEKALIALAEREGGTAVLNVQLRVILHEEQPDQIDITGIDTIPVAANG